MTLQPATPPPGTGTPPPVAPQPGPAVTPVAARRRKPGYAELHAHSSFSFLDGASTPEALVTEAARLGLAGLAITDHNGLYGVVRHADAARDVQLPAVHGAELSLGLTAPGVGDPDPDSAHLLVLARGPEGYARLSRMIGRAQLAGGRKGLPIYDEEQLAAELRDHVVVLTGGCRKSHIGRALTAGGEQAARAELDRLTGLYGREGVVVELADHDRPGDDDRNDILAALARDARLPVVATNNVHYATPADSRLAAIMAATRAQRPLTEMAGWLPPAATAHLRSAAEMAERFAWCPDALATSVHLAGELAFDLQLLAPALPPFPTGDGHTEDSWLRKLALEGAARRYGPRHEHPDAYRQLDIELRIISGLGFAGYFLVVWDLVRFCREHDILCQGRGSAANSVVCYALGVTNADPIRYKLLFERFLSPEREGAPDIDIDIEHARREEVIQYVYERHGRERTALVANVITYRTRSAIRDVARAFGYSVGQADAWSRDQPRHSPTPLTEPDTTAEPGEALPGEVVTYAEQLRGHPRHLGIHSGGMVICDRPVIDVVPVEWATMENRSVLQWDKDDCASAGLVKFDLLGLGMLTALHYVRDFANSHYDVPLDLSQLPADDRDVFRMISDADTIGVFQVESRAQMSLLPRLRPETFYDLVCSVALIRPGPVQGGSVHPFVRRRHGDEPITYPHPLAEGALQRTLGVIIFQEQVQMLAISLGGLTGAEADQLRRAMNAKNAETKLAKLRARLFEGMAARGIPETQAHDLYASLEAFSGYGFPEAHSISFAHIVWQSCWAKRWYPAAFCAGLLAAQPLGFYSPQTLVADARRHGVTVHGPDVNASQPKASLEGTGRTAPRRTAPGKWGRSGPVVCIGLTQIRSIGDDLAAQIAEGAPYTSITDLARRTGATRAQLEALATAGALESLGQDRRRSLWAAGAAARAHPGTLPGTTPGAEAPMLPGMDALDIARADAWATGITKDHPVAFLRPQLNRQGVVPVSGIPGHRNGARVTVAGQVTHRQMPQTADGVMFLSLEDETGILNVICTPGLLAKAGRVIRRSGGLIICGQLQSAGGAISLAAERVTPLGVPIAAVSRDFR
ncbi:error-prone DNA polymerase [Longispora albida]|uniref:error-prone DNA polymerase n=1 Tax=Longispora albida TaxID=203523 RepID=UPI00037EFD2D|nr:error-prone DNA polymerase [Longispora albida]